VSHYPIRLGFVFLGRAAGLTDFVSVLSGCWAILLGTERNGGQEKGKERNGKKSWLVLGFIIAYLCIAFVSLYFIYTHLERCEPEKGKQQRKKFGGFDSGKEEWTEESSIYGVAF